MKLIVIKKKSCKKASLKVHVHKFDTCKGQGTKGGGGGEKRAVHKRTMGEVIVILRIRE